MQMAPRHQIERVKRQPVRRTIAVREVRQLTPKMLRIEFESPELAGFESASADDHIKLFVPDPAGKDGVTMRDYTPRAFDTRRGALTIDFAIHDAGPATAWARAAKPGDRIGIGGPRGSAVVPDDFDHYLLVGDETALPSIGRRIEELRPGVPVTIIVVVDGPEEVQTFQARADLTPIWVFRNGGRDDDGELLRAALVEWAAPSGDGYVWIAAEAQAARLLKTYMLQERRHPAAWLKAAGYWISGTAGESDKSLED